LTYTGAVPAYPEKFKAIKDTSGVNGRWSFPEPMGQGVGFIYAIYDTVLNRAYLGKKAYFGSGKLNKGKPSDWKRYLSSSNVIGAHLKERPLSEFEFVCIEQYKTKGTLSYAETWSLCKVEAPTSVLWYNTRIEPVSWPVKEGITDRHKERLDEIQKRIAHGNA
jgi:hypothetical protein